MAAPILTTFIDTEYILAMELLLRKQFTRFRLNMADNDIGVAICFFRFACQMADSCVRSWTRTRHWVSSGRTFLGRLKIRPTAILDSCRYGYIYAHSGVPQNTDVCSEPRASNLFSSYFKPEVCQNIALFALTAARNFAFQMLTFWVYSAAFFLSLFFSPIFLRC